MDQRINLKKPIPILIIFLMSAPLFAEGFQMSAGVSIGYGASFSYDYLNIIPVPMEYNGTMNHFILGAYFDITYARFTFDYFTNIGNPISSMPVSSDLHASQLVFGVLVKHPLFIKSFQLWSGIGIKYLYTLLMDYNGDGIDDRLPDDSFDDILLTIHIGAEFKLFKIFTIGPTVTLDYNLTPNRKSYEPEGSRHTSILLEFALTVGIAF